MYCAIRGLSPQHCHLDRNSTRVTKTNYLHTIHKYLRLRVSLLSPATFLSKNKIFYYCPQRNNSCKPLVAFRRHLKTGQPHISPSVCCIHPWVTITSFTHQDRAWANLQKVKHSVVRCHHSMTSLNLPLKASSVWRMEQKLKLK